MQPVEAKYDAIWQQRPWCGNFEINNRSKTYFHSVSDILPVKILKLMAYVQAPLSE